MYAPLCRMTRNFYWPVLTVLGSFIALCHVNLSFRFPKIFIMKGNGRQLWPARVNVLECKFLMLKYNLHDSLYNVGLTDSFGCCRKLFYTPYCCPSWLSVQSLSCIYGRCIRCNHWIWLWLYRDNFISQRSVHFWLNSLVFTVLTIV